MDCLDLTLPTAAENLALDEALLEEAEAAPQPRELLRLWESPEPAVILGRSSRLAEEVCREACERRGIPILRRSSGGASVVIGPGCLMYGVILSYELRPSLAALDEAHRYVLSRVAAAARQLDPDAEWRGTSDLTVRNRKFSGNSLRCKRRCLLYHGTLLYDFDLSLVGELLGVAPRQPEYRAGRDHGEFVANLPTTADALREALRREWQVDESRETWPKELVEQLVAERYSQRDWNERL